MNCFRRVLTWYSTAGLEIVVAIAVVVMTWAPAESVAAGTASDGPGDAAAWTTGNKLAVGTSADTTSKVWFTVAKGITSEVFYPRLDVPNMQDMQYIVTDGSTFVDLERDATNHAVSMPDEKALEYTVTNTDKRATPKYRITNTYITDPSRNTLLIRTRFQSLDGGTYRLYLLENPSMAGGGANDNAWWDATNSALMSSGTETLFGSSMTVVSASEGGKPERLRRARQRLLRHGERLLRRLAQRQGAQQPVRQHRRQRQRRAVRPSRQHRHRHDVHRRARLRQRRGIGRRRRQRIACGRLHRSRSRLPRHLAAQRWLEWLRERAARSTRQRVERHAASPRLLRRRDGLARRRGQDVPRRQRRRVRDALGRLHEWGHPQRRLPPGVGSRPVSAGNGLDRRRRLRAGAAHGAVHVEQPVHQHQHRRRRDDVSARLVPALQPGQRDQRCDAAAARLLRAARPGCLRDPACLDDRSDRQRHLPEDQGDGEPHPGGGTRHDGALGGAGRQVAVVDRGGDRRPRRGGGYRPPERRQHECHRLGVDGRLVAIEPRRLDVHDQRLLGRPPVLRAYRQDVEPQRRRRERKALLPGGLLPRSRRRRLSGFSISSGSASACPTTPTCRCRSRRPPRRRTATPRCR